MKVFFKNLKFFNMNANIKITKFVPSVTQKHKKLYNIMSLRQKNILSRRKIKKRKRIYPQKMFLTINAQNLTSNIHTGQVTTSNQVIKLQKNDVEDIEDDIDIEANGNNDCNKTFIPNEEESMKNNILKHETKHPNIHPSLTTLNIPFEEYVYYDMSLITDQEKHFVYEFFEGQQHSKTPERYLKIRNQILHCWKNSKPNYVTKTSVRSSLKNCGDVNIIGKIHTYLEQIGAINFECEKVVYVRPLAKLLLPSTVKRNTEKINNIQVPPNTRQKRNKRFIKFNGEEGGYTFTHDETGKIIETTIVNKEENTPRKYRKPTIELISCKTFSPEIPAPYIIKINISALLHMDWHAHTSFDEVMGLLGGIYDQRTNILYIKRYVPCESVTNSQIHCDMCPISQSMAQETLQNDNLQVSGWFHSHPTFSTNPSEQDVETQLNMQTWMQRTYNGLPLFVGIILSPFPVYKNKSHISDYQCIIIKSENDNDGNTISVPYRFKTSIVSYDIDIEQLVHDLKLLYNKTTEFNLLSPYINDTSITYLDKMLTSTKFHLMKCGNGYIENTCDIIFREIKNLGLKTT